MDLDSFEFNQNQFKIRMQGGWMLESQVQRILRIALNRRDIYFIPRNLTHLSKRRVKTVMRKYRKTVKDEKQRPGKYYYDDVTDLKGIGYE